MENIAFFIPIYNEITSKEIISENINKIFKVFINSRIYFSDNCSEDGTWEFIQTIKEANSASIHLTRKSENIGFSRNLLSINEIQEDDECYIMICGGNDILLEDGLRNLKETLQKRRPCLVMANWSYHAECDGKTKIISTHDVTNSFETNKLNTFFEKEGCVPVGICQYTAKKKIFKSMHKWENLTSPQIGVFIDAFPCNFIAIGNPPTHSAKYIEKSGWRRNAELIFNTQVGVVEEIIEVLKYAYANNKISKCIYIATCTRYVNYLPKLLYNMYSGSWGQWKEGGQLNVLHYARVLKVIQIGSKTDIRIFTLLMVNLMIQKLIYSSQVIKYHLKQNLPRF
jgi:hypothetical protein